jgi:hypothetical protein
MDAYLEQQTRGAFAEHNGKYDDPGATRMWFGKHVGERFDQLEPSYRRWLLNTHRKGPYRHMIRDVSIHAISSDVQGELISVVRGLQAHRRSLRRKTGGASGRVRLGPTQSQRNISSPNFLFRNSSIGVEKVKPFGIERNKSHDPGRRR